MFEDLLTYVVDEGLKLGAEYVEVRYHKNTSFNHSARNGEVIGVGRNFSEGIGIRVLVKGSMGFSATNILTRESVREALEKAFKQAKAHSSFMKEPIKFAEARMGKASYEALEKIPFDSVEIEEKIKFHNEAWNTIKNVLKEAKIPVLFTSMNESIEEKIVVNSDGAFVKSRVPRISVMYNVVVAHPQKGSIQRFRSFGASGGFEWFKKWDPVKVLLEEVKTFERILVEGKKPPSEEVDVVVGSEVVGLIVHESCGHPSEADRIWGREAAQAGKSFIKKGIIGERIGSKYSTVIDDPTIPGSSGFYLYDDEGVPARPRYLYKEGVINEHLHNRWTAYLWGVESNAAARSAGYYGEPIIRMANTYFKPGDYTFEELIEDIRYGVFIKSYMEWNIDDERWSQRYGGLEAYLIENGELKGFIRNPVLEITTKAFYSKVDGADKNLEFYPGTCGKGEPMQGVPVWFGGPNVRLRKVRLGVIPA
ncbi:MAG TPA: TldD/PmbA family protein [Thermoproteales archaeon]|nr:TldD/PmbA family protein [Thermoproteales archaeon]